MTGNPFGDDPTPARPPNPFGDEPDPGSEDPVAAIEYAAGRIRRLRPLVGAEGLTVAGTRDLIEQLGNALDAIARALRTR